MSTAVENVVGNYTVTFYNKETNLIHSVHNFTDVGIADVVDAARKEVESAVDPTGISQAHIGYADNLRASVSDTATGEGVAAPAEQTAEEKLLSRLEIAEANNARYEALLAQREGQGVAVEAPDPFNASGGSGLPLNPGTVPGTPVDAPKPNVFPGQSIPPKDGGNA